MKTWVRKLFDDIWVATILGLFYGSLIFVAGWWFGATAITCFAWIITLSFSETLDQLKVMGVFISLGLLGMAVAYILAWMSSFRKRTELIDNMMKSIIVITGILFAILIFLIAVSLCFDGLVF